MTLAPARWRYIKNLRPSPGKMFHVSLFYHAVQDPVSGVVSYKQTQKGRTYRKPQPQGV